MAELETIETGTAGAVRPPPRRPAVTRARRASAAPRATPPAAGAAPEEKRDIREHVRSRYAAAAVAASEGTTRAAATRPSSPTSSAMPSAPALYESEERGALPDAAKLASLGCGNPTAVADLHEGETVLDLGSGGGIDVLLSARRVGPTGMAYGLDMTDEMLDLARRNHEAEVENVEFLKGTIEDIPLPDDSVDVIISNCVINLSGDKPACFARPRACCGPAGASRSATWSPTRTWTRRPAATWSSGRAASPAR